MSGIIHVSEMVSIAFHSMIVIAAKKDVGLLNVKEIAKIIGASESHLSKVMQRLVKAKFLRSVRGPKGGFALINSPDQISLLDIFEVIEGPFINNQCPTSCDICSFKACILGGVPEKMNKEFKEYLMQHKLSDLIPLLK
ncbi:transcriptional regulator, BadM/Rrf2 family [Natronincola peptidivorans]|uniref:Transcriptional regulator, BadM/Rrf2 family n=1 Tax=Natronincola peptidivorans TaxID=426128 RepID=A0A1I0EVC7_9FIRM|nr:Rrf2 family transcriptional regulator [Natronincola peptidivorans]SET49550.1 transcriptional regulator, BadM/Rrf2 family [Natronincola peptidivorans]